MVTVISLETNIENYDEIGSACAEWHEYFSRIIDVISLVPNQGLGGFQYIHEY
jgi:hypothetical protein